MWQKGFIEQYRNNTVQHVLLSNSQSAKYYVLELLAVLAVGVDRVRSLHEEVPCWSLGESLFGRLSASAV